MTRAALLGEHDFFPLELESDLQQALPGLRHRLTAAGYHEEGLCALLDLRAIYEASSEMIPVWDRYVLDRSTTLHTLTRLLFLGLSVEEEAVAAALGAEATAQLRRLRLLEQVAPGQLQCPVTLFPFAGLVVATDRFYEEEPDAQLVPSRVMYLGGDSCTMALWAAASAGGRTLDLCTGSGIAALLCARQGGSVVGVDINPRAVNFARFNAVLNGIANCAFHQGDLYQPLPAGAFQLIVANPPFVPTSSQAGLLFRDGGERGEEVLAGILEGSLERLEPGGLCLIRTDLVHAEEVSYQQKLERWLGPGPPISCALLELEPVTPVRYAVLHHRATLDRTRGQDELFRWLDSYRELGIESIAPGYIALRREASGERRVARISLPGFFPRHGRYEGFTQRLLDRLHQLDAASEQVFTLNCEPGEANLARPQDLIPLVQMTLPLAVVLHEIGDAPLTVKRLIEALTARGYDVKEQVEELTATLKQLYLAGYLDLPETSASVG